jgi:hypothetical protein
MFRERSAPLASGCNMAGKIGYRECSVNGETC